MLVVRLSLTRSFSVKIFFAKLCVKEAQTHRDVKAHTLFVSGWTSLKKKILYSLYMKIAICRIFCNSIIIIAYYCATLAFFKRCNE